ncbi:MAG: hypothetical protein HFH80_08435 [Lachnospiraceae bacterium]|nr:hypothetical protein [Lachnospiraceae bacterium]
METGKNSEGYFDPTASAAIERVSREEGLTDRRARNLVQLWKRMARAAGFELTARIQLKDIRSGREFR